MRKISSFGCGLVRKIRYNYTPVSTYKIQNKPNPIIAVTFGNDTGSLLDFQFRVPS